VNSFAAKDAKDAKVKPELKKYLFVPPIGRQMRKARASILSLLHRVITLCPWRQSFFV
jgi:hypothetical protein